MNLTLKLKKLFCLENLLPSKRPLVNLAIGIGNGIGIETDITNAIISSSVWPMDSKRSRVVT